MRLEIKSPKDTPGNVDMNSVEFRVGFFDFPMIDNTRLTHDQRVAVVLNAFEEGSADVTLAYFPGSYASLKEKPYYHDVVQKLMGANEGMNRGPDNLSCKQSLIRPTGRAKALRHESLIHRRSKVVWSTQIITGLRTASNGERS